MSNYRRLLSGAAILAILVVAAISFNYRQVEAQGPGGAPVIIQNPLPLPVRDVDVAARIPFNIVFRFLGDFGPIHTVPNDRRMTIEFVSALCRNTLAQSPGLQVSLSTRVGGTLAEHRLDPRLLESFGFNVYSVSNVVRIYADPGTEVRATAVGNTPGDCSITLSGFLEQVPTRG